MLFSFIVTLREGLEIAFVLAILFGYLRGIGRREHFRELWMGAGVAALACVGIGVVLTVASRELEGRVVEAFEGFTMLFAVGVLTWMVFWMKAQSVGISHELRERVDRAIGTGSVLALALLAFSAVGREGLETTLFLFAGSTAADSGPGFVAGGLAGFALAAAAGIALYYGSHRLPLRAFFTISAIVVIVLAAGLLSTAVAELKEAGILTNLGVRPWDVDALVSMTSTTGKFLHALLGYDSAPTLVQIILYWTYLSGSLLFYLMPVPRRRNPVPSPAARPG